MYQRGRQIEGPARTGPVRSRQGSRAGQPSAISGGGQQTRDPDFAEEFLTFVVREVIRRHESVRRNHLTCISG